MYTDLFEWYNLFLGHVNVRDFADTMLIVVQINCIFFFFYNIRFQTFYINRNITKFDKTVLSSRRCLENPIIQHWRYLSFINVNTFCHRKLENEWGFRPPSCTYRLMTLPSRHRFRNSSPGVLRPSTLPFGHRGSPQYWIFTSVQSMTAQQTQDIHPMLFYCWASFAWMPRVCGVREYLPDKLQTGANRGIIPIPPPLEDRS